MIPILYESTETEFTSNGLGRLSDAISCIVEEERNGAYELSLQYPITGRYFGMIEDAIIKAKANETSDAQLFRVYKSTKPLKGIVTFYAEHISYDLNGLPLAGFSCAGTTPLVAINKALDETPLEHSFSAWSDIATLNGTKIKEPPSVRGLLGGQEGSILDVWGGEYEFDNFTIKLHAHRGADNGVSIEYGKNLTDIKQERNISECYTHIMPYAVYTRDDGSGNSEEVYVYLTERVLALPNAPSLGHYRAFRYDCSGEFGDGEVPTESKIRALTNRYIASHDLTTPKVNITVSFINLADTVEYKNIAPLERVRLCDTVAVKFSKLGITASAKIIKTVYNVLKEKYDSITVGDAKSSFADTVHKQSGEITRINAKVAENKSRATIELENAIARATAAITGQSGGYVVLNPAENPQEILILDAQSGGDIEQAVNVWRFNSAGLGHSSSGYDGTYTTAITYDGKIVADFIAAGTLNGELLRAGSVEANAISSAFKQIITDEISGSATTLRQEFAAADGVLQSSITDITKTNGTIDTKIGAALSEYSTTAQITTILTNYSTIQQTASEISTVVGRINEIVQTDGTAGTSLSNILSNYSTITQTATEISSAVSTKVDNSEFGTKITQNSASVRIAWNNLSQYIQFEGAQLNIYDATNKIISFNSSGEDIYYKGSMVGNIGSGYWVNPNDSADTSKRGIAFHLENSSAFMSWGRKNSENNLYATKWLYAASAIPKSDGSGNFAADTLHAGCDIDMHYYDFRNWDFAGGCISGTFSGRYVTAHGSDGSLTTKAFSLTFKNGILQSASW